jgi:hypothetical protein
MGFAGNVEPCFITPTVVAVNDSSTAQTPAARGAHKGNWLAQHSAGVMADLDFYIGEEALARSRASSTYSLSYPIRNGQVGAAAVYCRRVCVEMLLCLHGNSVDLSSNGLCRWRIGTLWRGSGSSASSIISGVTRKIIIFFSPRAPSLLRRPGSTPERSCSRRSMFLASI